MADGQLTSTAAQGRARIALRIGVIYLAARVVTTTLLLIAAELSGLGSRMGEGADIGDVIVAWDGQWYWYLAEVGYPADLPRTESGQIAENAWAFMPLFAYLAKLVGLPFGHWAMGALIVSLLAGYAASVVLYHLLRLKLDDVAATWSVVFFASAPLAALFQVGYAESLNLLWLFLALWCVLRRRYGWLYALIPLMAFTRPGVLAFSLFLGLFGIWRWFSRAREPLRRSEVVHIVALGLLAAVAGFAWQLIAGWVTGEPGAYLSTELAWRRNWIPGDAAFFPFEGFVTASVFWFESIWHLPAVLGYAALGGILLAATAALLLLPQVRALGVEIRLWSASYLVYLLLVFFPQSSIFRLLVPLSPLWGAFAAPRSPVWRFGVLAACILGQWWWIYNMYALGNTIWQVP